MVRLLSAQRGRLYRAFYPILFAAASCVLCVICHVSCAQFLSGFYLILFTITSLTKYAAAQDRSHWRRPFAMALRPPPSSPVQWRVPRKARLSSM